MRHLLTRCENCLSLLQRVSAEAGYWLSERGAAAFGEKDFERRSAMEHLRGWAHWSAIEPLAPVERLATVTERKHWHHWGLFRALLDAACSYRRCRNPLEAADITLLAIAVVDLLDADAAGGAAAVCDLRAAAFSVLACCRQRAGNLDGARRALSEAWKWNEQGTGDPSHRARVLRANAAYAAAAGELETAELILEKALSLYLSTNEPHLQGRTLIAMGEAIGYTNPDRGIAHIQHGLQLTNPAREPRLHLQAQHLLAEFLCALGRAPEALAIVSRARPLYAQFEELTLQLELQGLLGRISRGLDDLEEAADIFRLVREACRSGDLRREFVLATIDLAEVQVKRHKPTSALRLFEETLSDLMSYRLHRNGLMAWLLLQKATEEADGRVAGRLAQIFASARLYYRRYWYVPEAELSVP